MHNREKESCFCQEGSALTREQFYHVLIRGGIMCVTFIAAHPRGCPAARSCERFTRSLLRYGFHAPPECAVRERNSLGYGYV